MYNGLAANDELQNFTERAVLYLTSVAGGCPRPHADTLSSLSRHLSLSLMARKRALKLDALPADVLCRIADFLDLKGRLLLSHSSHRVRSVILDFKHLWATPTTIKSTNRTLLHLVLQRSAPLPLDLTFLVYPLFDYHGLLEQELGRLHSLRVENTMRWQESAQIKRQMLDHWMRLLRVLTGGASRLVSLTLSDDSVLGGLDEPVELTLPSEFLDRQPGSLKSLTLHRFALPDSVYPVLSRLTTFNYTPVSDSITGEWVERVLVAMPMLVHLGLSFRVFAPSRSNERSAILKRHRSLKRAVIRDVCVSSHRAVKFFGRLGIPDLFFFRMHNRLPDIPGLLMGTSAPLLPLDLLKAMKEPDHLQMDQHGLILESARSGRRVYIDYNLTDDTMTLMSFGFWAFLTSVTISEVMWEHVPLCPPAPLVDTLCIWVATYREWSEYDWFDFEPLDPVGLSAAWEMGHWSLPSLRTVHFTCVTADDESLPLPWWKKSSCKWRQSTFMLSIAADIVSTLHFDAPRLHKLNFSRFDSFADVDLASALCNLYALAESIDFLSESDPSASRIHPKSVWEGARPTEFF